MPARPSHRSLFDVDWLDGWLAAAAGTAALPALCVAWSGGADSTALVHALVQLRDRRRASGQSALVLRAVHVDHGLQQAAELFSRHCRRLASQWQLPLLRRRVQVALGPGVSVEQAARQARYDLLAAVLRPGEWLLTAQHADDQLETVLLQALRGAGAAGLAGMAARAPLGRGELLRPLLALPRQSLLDYLEHEGVGWIDDPSNADLRFDRNYLRQRVLPALLERWPAAARTVARGARLAAEANATVSAQAHRDWQAAADGSGLDVQVLRRYTPVRQRALLRAWIQACGAQVPDEQRLEALRVLADLRADATPALRWGSLQARRQGGRLLLGPAVTPKAMHAALNWPWQRQRRLPLPAGGALVLQRDAWGDVDLSRLPPVLQLRWRSGGEQLRSGGLNRDVKALLREAQLPVWQRDVVPLLADPADAASPLLAVADIAVADTIRATNASTARGRFIWQQD